MNMTGRFPPEFLASFGAQLAASNAAQAHLQERDDAYLTQNQESEQAREKRDREDEEANDREDAYQVAWSQKSHTYFGATMTGQQWGELGRDIKKDGQLRDWLIAQLMRDGRSKEDAEKKADEMAEVYRILSTSESKWTPEERAKVEAAKKDPDFQKNTEPLERRKEGYGARASETEVIATNATQSVSTGAGADALRTFPAAPGATEHYRKAVAAVEPLEGRTSQPVQIAAVPAVAPGGGFDV